MTDPDPQGRATKLSNRVKDQLPTVLLTLLSIVQALALELLWGHASTQASLFEGTTLTLWLEWLQLVATFIGVLLVWLIYSSMVMRFRWVPTTGDLVFPFLVGILEFLMIELLGSHVLGPWLVVLGVIFAIMTWASQMTYRRARLDPENSDFFGNTPPASAKDFLMAGIVVLMLVGTGIVIWALAHQGWFAIIAILGAIGALLMQMYLTDLFWRRSVFGNSPSQNTQ